MEHNFQISERASQLVQYKPCIHPINQCKNPTKTKKLPGPLMATVCGTILKEVIAHIAQFIYQLLANPYC